MNETDRSSGFGGGWRALAYGIAEGVDRDRVYRDILESGGATGRYVMMSVLSAAIATLGLLLSSPAVVIGAMLLSPLMGPIILLGFSFCAIDWGATRRALVSLALGSAVALAVAVALTWISPLKEPTAEILARARPNLFDLLVAAFSGVAGGYAVIRQRGETVIGVAIATALMPPIAVIGFGLGTADWMVAAGAALLFGANLIAIALSAAGMAAIYGFRPHYRFANWGWIGNAAVIAIVAALCVPLTFSLDTIALESRATVTARAAIQQIFGPRARLTSLDVRSAKNGVQVDGLVATPSYVASASTRIARRIKDSLGTSAQVSLDQVVLADPSRFVAPPAAPDPVTTAIQALRDAVPFPDASIAYDPDSHRGVVLLGASSGLDLDGAMALEQGLRQRDGLDATLVIPPGQALAPVTITLKAKTPVQFGPALAAEAWALKRWRVRGVTAWVCGLSHGDHRVTDVEVAVDGALKPLDVSANWGDRARCGAPPAAGPFVKLAGA